MKKRNFSGQRNNCLSKDKKRQFVPSPKKRKYIEAEKEEALAYYLMMSSLGYFRVPGTNRWIPAIKVYC